MVVGLLCCARPSRENGTIVTTDAGTLQRMLRWQRPIRGNACLRSDGGRMIPLRPIGEPMHHLSGKIVLFTGASQE
jgi:hypothetical protein